VEAAFEITGNLSKLTVEVLAENPGLLSVLRMAVAPPIAQDRLVGLAYTSKTIVNAMEGKGGKPPRLPPNLSQHERESNLSRILDVIGEMLDIELFPWLSGRRLPEQMELRCGLAVVADRLCGAAADPIVRNAQEQRQLGLLSAFLAGLGYREVAPDSFDGIGDMSNGTFTFRKGVAGRSGNKNVNIPIDCIISRHDREYGEWPILIEAKSVGNATTADKKRKEEAQKFAQLKEKHGKEVRFVLLLGGYFNAGYLGYEAAEGIDWVWEHRITDLLKLGLAQAKPLNICDTSRETAVAYLVPAESEKERECVRFQ
jgi:hypothetical protein